MPPSKRKLPPKPKELKNKIPIICYCKNCSNKGSEIYENVWLCDAGVNLPYGNYSVMNCLKYIEK